MDYGVLFLRPLRRDMRYVTRRKDWNVAIHEQWVQVRLKIGHVIDVAAGGVWFDGLCRTKSSVNAKNDARKAITRNFYGTKPMAKSQDISTIEDERRMRQARAVHKLDFLGNEANGRFSLGFMVVTGAVPLAGPLGAGYSRGRVPS
jgi:hypothetical protein